MKCPYCSFPDSKVIDSRPKDEKIKRRRECINCGARFTTFEEVEKPLLMVEKRSGSYEEFDRNKLITGIFNAIKKRPVSMKQVENIADNIENHYANALRTVAKSKEIGELVSLTPENVRVRSSRALEKLRKQLETMGIKECSI